MLLEPPVSSGPYPQARSGANRRGRILLFGVTSITGYALARLGDDGLVAVASRAATRRRPHWRVADADDRADVAAVIESERPDIVLWAHAVCDVTKCEANPEWAESINVRGIDNLLRSLPRSTRLVYLSSDHVFGEDGSYTESCTPCPISVYGRTRVVAEEMVLQRPNALVVRPGLAIGPSADGRSGFMDWLAYRHRRGLPVTVIADESRSAVWADDLALRLMDLANSDIVGLRHVPAARAVSRPELASALLERRGISPRLTVKARAEQPVPHLGRIEIRSIHRDVHAAVLPAVV